MALYIYLFVSVCIFFLLSWKSHLQGILDLHNDKDMALVVISLTILFIGYFLTLTFTKWNKVSFRQVFIPVVALNVAFLFVPFLSSNDLYSYIFSGRVYHIWGENPYLVPYSSFPNDPLYKSLETVWAKHTVLYGPAFLYVSGYLNLLLQDNFLLLTGAFKGLFLLANILIAFLIYKITNSKKSVYLYSLNPLVIYELSGNIHTESLLLLFLAFSFYLLYKRPVLSFSVFTFSVLVKYYSALFAPLYLIYLKKKSMRQLLIALTVGALISVLLYLPFWTGFEIFDYLMSYYNGIYPSPSLGIYFGEVLLESYHTSFQINTIIFFVLTGILIFRFWKSEATFKEFIFSTILFYLVYILFKLSLVMVWYLIPIIFIASLTDKWKEYNKFVFILLLLVSTYALSLYYFLR